MKPYSSLSILTVLLAVCISACASSSKSQAEKSRMVQFECSSYTWTDIEKLVQPYLDDTLYTALVMQAQSSEYQTSEAVRHVLQMDANFPHAIEVILRSVSEANC